MMRRFNLLQANWRVKLKSNISDDTEVAWQTGKIAAKVEINWKGESSVSDRKGEIDFTYEYRVSKSICSTKYLFVCIISHQNVRMLERETI